MTLKRKAADAGWSIRQTAWGLEDRFAWRGERLIMRSGDVARDALEPALKPVRAVGDRALDGMEPLQRLVQTKLAWPVADAARNGNTAVKTGLATAAIAAVAATGGGAAALAGGDGQAPAAVTAAAPVPQAQEMVPVASTTTLNGVEPDFDAGKSAKTSAPVADAPAAAKGKDGEPTPILVPAPTAAPSQVADAFAQAFVRYEVGKVDPSTHAVFQAVAEKPLAQTLQQDPPRLPAGTDVPEARVLNVIVSDPEKVDKIAGPGQQKIEKVQQIEASVSLARMEAASELRLTLEATPDGWQVVEVRG